MQSTSSNWVRVAVNVVAFLGIFFILAGLVYVMYHYTQPGPVDESHWGERVKNLAELRAQNAERLGNYAWIDSKRGLVSLPVSRAMELTAREWQDPRTGRSNMLARLERALPPVPTAAGTNAPPASTGTTNSPSARPK